MFQSLQQYWNAVMARIFSSQDITSEEEEFRNEIRDFKPEKDFGGGIGSPLCHHRYSTFKEGKFTDFTLIWSGRNYPVHKSVLSSECGFFRSKFRCPDLNGWVATVVNIPDSTISNETIEVFLCFLYTSLVSQTNLERYFFELYDLSLYFQAKKLTTICAKNLLGLLNAEIALALLLSSRARSDSLIHQSLVTFIAENYWDLTDRGFPFYKTGKTMLLQIFKHIHDTKQHVLTRNVQTNLGPKIRNPSDHTHFQMLRTGNYSDFTLKWSRKEYFLHKYVLYSESLYFKTLFSSEWKETDARVYELVLPKKEVSRKAFFDFLSFLYTGFITEEDLLVSLFELYDLADYFQVVSLKDLVLLCFKKYLKDETAELFLKYIQERDLTVFKGIMANYIAARYFSLSARNFPFHKVGKIMLSKIFKRIVAISRTPGSVKTIEIYPVESTSPPEDEDDEEIEEF
jgi:hypothetical protein